jgi:lipopolysaccharide/colanic/teichoic acid biosynthesis glycosyltransferase
LLADLVWVVLAPAAALLLRDNLEISPDRFEALAPYSAISVVVAAVLFPIAGINRSIWQYTSLREALRIAVAVALSIALALGATFALNRLEGVARSLPLIEGLLLFTAMTGARVAMRLLRGGPTRATEGLRLGDGHDQRFEHLLVVGLNAATEIYLRSIAEFAPKRMLVAGILAEGLEFRGRSLQDHKVLGSPDELPQVLAQLKVHGVTIERVVMTQPLAQLSARAREALLAVERSHGVILDHFVERLVMTLPGSGGARGADGAKTSAKGHPAFAAAVAMNHYAPAKRFGDICGALLLIVALAPIGAVVGLLVALDIGFPLLFWQLRPGRYGRPFKLYKFRTMAHSHDAGGNRIPDEQRATMLGQCLRRLRLDELPQLYNILRGEMSLVGPRPLLPADQPGLVHARLVARPGLTGWAQVNGGRDLSADDKTALDIWYVRNASFWLDVRILFRTFVTVVTGERRNDRAIRLAVEDLGQVRVSAVAKARDDAPVLIRTSAPVLLPVQGENGGRTLDTIV